MAFPTEQAISSGTGLIGSIAQAIQARKDRKQSVENQNRTIQANKEMAEYAYSKDLEMWNRQNQYNNPANQMQRLKDAGINPVLAFGKSDIGGNTSGQMPKYNAPRIDYNAKAPQIAGVLSAFQDFSMRSAQIDLVKEQVHTQQEIQNEKRLGNMIKDIDAHWYQSKTYMSKLLGSGKTATARVPRGFALRESQYELQKELKYQAELRNQSRMEEIQMRKKDNILKNMELQLYNNLGTHGKGANMALQFMRMMLGNSR